MDCNSHVTKAEQCDLCFSLHLYFYLYLYISLSVSVWGRRSGWTVGRCTSGIKNPLREPRPTSLSVTRTTASSLPRWASPGVSAITLFIITLFFSFIFRQPCNLFCGHVFMDDTLHFSCVRQALHPCFLLPEGVNYDVPLFSLFCFSVCVLITLLLSLCPTVHLLELHPQEFVWAVQKNR